MWLREQTRWREPSGQDHVLWRHVELLVGPPAGYAGRVVKLLENWRITHLFGDVVPALRKAGVSEERIDAISVENPKRLFDSPAALGSGDAAGKVGT